MFAVLNTIICSLAVVAIGVSAGQGKGWYVLICLLVALYTYRIVARDYKQKEARWEAEQRR
jgi:4-hydroxybenzoate polyprenyltransferase